MAARNLLTVLLLAGTMFGGVEPPCRCTACNPGVATQPFRCCCNGGILGKCCGMACCRVPTSQERPNLPRRSSSSNDRQLLSTSIAAWATVIGNDGDSNATGLFDFSRQGTAISVPTLQAQHVRIQT